MRSLYYCFCDNNKASTQDKDPRSHQKSKQIERRFHVIREIIGRGDISIQKIHTTENVADPFTKAMTQEQLDHHRQEMGIRYIVDWL